MAKLKGCTNSYCAAHKKKVTYKATEEFCSKCGQPLSFVCKSCYTPIEESQKLCVMCQAKIDDRNDKIKNGALKVSGFLLTVGTVAVSKGKDITKHIPKK